MIQILKTEVWLKHDMRDNSMLKNILINIHLNRKLEKKPKKCCQYRKIYSSAHECLLVLQDKIRLD